MPYTELKEKLEQLLTQDLSNRNTLQETRRNLFLNSEGSKVQQQLLEQKQSEIQSLSTLVEKKKTIVQLKDDEIAILRSSVKELQEKLTLTEDTFNLQLQETESNLQNKLKDSQAEWQEKNAYLSQKLKELTAQLSASTGLENKITELSLQNDEYSAKIRELIYHIDAQNTEVENLKNELSSKTQALTSLVDPKLLEEKNNEIENLKSQLTSALEAQSLMVEARLLEEKTAELEMTKEKAGLLADSEQQLKMLVASQNNDISTLSKHNTFLKKQIEDIASGWQQQQEQLLSDNSNLLAELALVKEAAANAVTETPAPTFTEEQINALVSEKEQLNSQLQAVTGELASLKESLNNSAPTASQSLSDEELESIRAEKEHLHIELQATRHQLDVTTQLREEKIILLQAEISNLQNQVISLSDLVNRESEEKSQITSQLEQLSNLVSEKEQKLNEMSKTNTDEEFIDKLMFQANRLNDEKHRLEMLYTESEAELTLTRTNLATLTQLIEEQKNSISGLEETDKHVKLAQTLMLQITDKTAAKQAINELVREIDRCIALLSE